MTCPIDQQGNNMCIERMILDFAMIGAQAETTCDIVVSTEPTGEMLERPVPCIHEVTYYARPTDDQRARWNADADGKVVNSLLRILGQEMAAQGRMN